MSRIVLDLSDPTPPYAQVLRELLAAIRCQELLPGERLPAIRPLARDLGLAPGTVARAYKELEELGAVTTRRSAGTRVADPLPAAVLADAATDSTFERSGQLRAAPPQRDLRQLAEDYARAARALGHDDADALAAVRAAQSRR